MKKLKTLLPILLLGTTFAGLTGCTNRTAPQSAEPKTTNSGKATQYTCPMHPEVVQSSPGKCPKCGMDLVEKH